MLDGANRSLIDEWLRRGPEIDRAASRLTVRSVKVFADGALGSRGAALLEPYSDMPGTKGVVTTSEAEIYGLTRRSLEAGFQVATHAIGDAANRFTLDAYQRALAETHARDARLRIEHAQVLAPAEIPRFAKLGVIASMQPAHCTSDMPWAEARVGPQRILGAYAWRSVLKTGAHLPLSSDFPGETLDPFAGMYAAVTRQDAAGKPPAGWYPDQRLTIQEALRGYTVEAAYAGFEEKDKGTIEPGKLADLTVISTDVTRAPPSELLALTVLWTMVGGRVVFDGTSPR
jgi:predicted amidohydrolase YtcJ